MTNDRHASVSIVSDSYIIRSASLVISADKKNRALMSEILQTSKTAADVIQRCVDILASGGRMCRIYDCTQKGARDFVSASAIHRRAGEASMLASIVTRL